MKLTKGKINKIKGKRLQSKKRIGNKYKHLVKHGRGLSYRKKRHLNFKNQTLKRFGIRGGADTDVVTDGDDGDDGVGVDDGIKTVVANDEKSVPIKTSTGAESVVPPVVSSTDSNGVSNSTTETILPVASSTYSNGVSNSTNWSVVCW
jgi:hypothetical protein